MRIRHDRMVRVFNRLFRLSRNKAKDMVAARFALWVWQTTRARQAWLKRTRAARKGGLLLLRTCPGIFRRILKANHYSQQY